MSAVPAAPAAPAASAAPEVPPAAPGVPPAAPALSVRGDLHVESRGGGVSVGQTHTFNLTQYQGSAPASPVPLPHRIGRVPGRAPHFQDRRESEALAAAPPGRPLILTGTAGTGKSQIAARFAENAWEQGELQLLLWIADATQEAVTAAYVRAAQDLFGRHFPDPAEGVQAFLNWLRPAGGTQPRPWLIVLDGVVDPAGLADWQWPPASPVGRVLVTSRRRDFDAAMEPEIIRVWDFTPEEARAYLHRALDQGESGPVSETEVGELADQLGGLPQALAHAVRHIATEGITVEEYVDLLDDREAYESVVHLPLWLSIEAADRAVPEGVTVYVLALASVLGEEGVPDDVLSCAPALALLTRLSEAAAEVTAGDVAAVLRVLHGHSLVDIQQERAYRTVRVETPVRGAVLAAVNAGPLADLVRDAAGVLAAVWPEVERDAGRAQLLRAGAGTLTDAADFALLRDGIHPVVFRAGRSAGESGRLAAAQAYFREVAAVASDLIGAEHPDVLRALVCAARWRGAGGDDAGAAAELTGLLASQRRQLAADHPDILTTRYHRAACRMSAEGWDSAGPRAAVTSVLADQTRVLGPDHPDTLATLLAVVEATVDQHAYAVGGADAVVERLLGPDRPDVIEEVDIAAALVTELERVLGPDRPGTVVARRLLAAAHLRAGDEDTARAVSATALAEAQRALGPGHPVTLAVRRQTAFMSRMWGGHVTATPALVGVLADQKKLLPADHPEILETRHCLLYIRYRVDQARTPHVEPDQLLDDYAALLADARRAFGPDHHRSLSVLDWIGDVQASLLSPVAAIVTLAEVVGRRSRVLGHDHPRTLDARTGLATRRGLAGDAVGAVVGLAEVVVEQTRILGPDHLDTLRTRYNLAVQRGKAGDLPGADAELTRLCSDVERIRGDTRGKTHRVGESLARWRRVASAAKPR
ncbi:tetratricopeptide repeat protein [Streptomyces sp. NBC_01477]|uniref:tetratricopeptide repeat protein n=1 Tax=Streptomyces sp. NBC_01477 TaxID=2976015 RepID=UPI002E33450F|nr:tetratricopeptide repeat protein [Streptomyces sp. NBC_01477]